MIRPPHCPQGRTWGRLTTRLGFFLLPAVLAALAGCASPQGGGSRASADERALAACSRQADDAYLRQNRDAIYQADQYVSGGRDSPFGGASGVANPSAGLSERYARETMVDDCLNAGTDQPGATPTPQIPTGINQP